ncbi:MAG TPA: c-type cytochrome, partial [Acidimicrobiia bacterium]|nr:c-type cytochrome [Acidimicrobiia bacterium]
MTADIITVLAVVAGIVWLGIMLVSALRNRGGAEEVASNLKPGIDDQTLETKRLEGGQKAAIAFSAFLAISLPLYFLGEGSRQEGFVEEFAEGSIERGQHLVEEFACYTCHGPNGSGGSAPFVEQRSGVTVSWAAPSLDDIFYRYDRDEVNFWVTYGRGNTPMPAWGLDGGGPMNEKQVEDVVTYLESIQISQQQVVDETVTIVGEQAARLETADETVRNAVIEQDQVVHEIAQAPEDLAVILPLADQAVEILANADEGIDTDADGLSDAAEAELSAISLLAYEHFVAVEPVQLDPEVADAELVDEGLAALEAAVDRDPIFAIYIPRIEAALADDEISEESPDTDGDGISDGGEATISGLFLEASGATVSDDLVRIDLDPASPETVAGEPDLDVATRMVGGLETVAINLGVAVENEDRILPQQEAGLQFLLDSQQAEAWAFDFAGVAEAMQTTEIEPVVLDPQTPDADLLDEGLAAMRTALESEPTFEVFIGAIEEAVSANPISETSPDSDGDGISDAAEEAVSAVFRVASPAQRAVYLYNGYCARCHTAGFSAGVPYAQEAGSGGFGPALWDGRPVVQFGEAPEDPEETDLLIDFLINGSEAQAPYGLNGFGSGRMPAFGAILDQEDIDLLARY